jgi:predicted enzyme related to lactoylglutathione lyase
MSERSEYNPGEFSWVDLATPDMEASASFYGELMGWEREQVGDPEETGGYGNFTREGKAVAGIGPLMAEGQPPAWSSYVQVADAGETAARVREAGGTVLMDPFDIPGGAGRMTVCHDPEGAFFSLWQAGAFVGAELVNEVGSWTWNQLVTRDLEGARRFYGDVFGWSLERAEEAPPDAPFYMWQVEGQRWEEGLGGLMLAGEDVPAEVPPHWQVYFAVEDAQRAIDATNAAGGKTYLGPIEIPVGKLGVLDDPQGAAFGIIEPDYPEER